MVQEATNSFVKNIGKMMDGSIESGFELIKNSKCAKLCKAAKDFDFRYGFQHKDVLQLELQGNNYIKGMMTMLWRAISKDGVHKDNPFERFAFGEISENYRRVFKDSDKSDYAKYQLLCDAVSGMTESHLIKKYNELKSLDNETT